MRYTILGFNQQMAIENNLSANDLLLLQYIIEANGQPNMQHIVDNEISYVWLSHSKIHDDLPILDYSESTLKHKLSELKAKGLIQSKSVANKAGKGSRTYYSITEKTTYFLIHSKTCSSAASGTSYNQLNNTNVYSNDVVSKNTTSSEQEPVQFEFGKPESSKPNLYQNCLAQINAYTEDTKLRNSLHNYLDLCMEMKSIRGANQWKGMLNTLDRVYEESNKGDEKHGYGEIIQQSIDHGWKTFYSIKPFTNNQASGISKNVLPLKGGTKYENEDKSFIEGVEF